MDTETVIESNLSISVNYNGVSPIGGGRMSFSPNHLTRLTPAGDTTYVKRIVFDDLETSGIYKSFQINYEDGDLTDAQGDIIYTPAGEAIPHSSSGTFLYIKSNASIVVTAASVPLPSLISANGAFLLDSTFNIADPGNGQPILSVKWLTTSLTAIGNSNFYCDLILAVA